MAGYTSRYQCGTYSYKLPFSKREPPQDPLLLRTVYHYNTVSKAVPERKTNLRVLFLEQGRAKLGAAQQIS